MSNSRASTTIITLNGPALATATATGFTPVVGEATTGLLAFLSSRNVIPSNATARVRAEGVRILTDCAAPTVRQARRVGLVCGYVQSGKTVSIETVAALAKDNGYGIVILLAGVTTNLVDQSSERMEEELRRGAGGYDWLMLENPGPSERQHLEGLIQYWRNRTPGAPGSRILFVTVIKNHRRLDSLSDLLESLQLAGIPALIFDDEADQASLNTRPLQPNPSTTYRCIERLRRALPHHTLLQYTATPQAPLLISRIDSLSADFADLVEAGEGYTGGQVFFRERRTELVRDIPAAEIFDHTNLPPEPPPSLLAAMQIFIVGVAVVARSEQQGHRSMLIHPHQRREVHQTFWRWVQALLRDWYALLMRPNDPDRTELIGEFEEAHRDLQATSTDFPPFERVVAALPEALNRVVVTLVNSDNGNEIRWPNGYAHILVGGEKLGRGYTVKGLTVTYMPRGPGGFNADTIQQRARFFGYHAKAGQSYVDLCRVYLHPSVTQVYADYVDHEEDLRDQIESHRGRPLKELKRAFILGAAMRPTRHNVMTLLYNRPRLQSGWLEQRAPHTAPGSANADLVAALRATITLQPHSEFARHKYADVSMRDFLSHFLVPFETPDDRDATPMIAVLMTLAGECASDPDATCRVFLMDADESEPRERSLGQDDSEIDLMQGRSSAAGPNRYPGDRHFHAPDRVTAQIHRLRIVRKDGRGVVTGTVVTTTFALAIRLPPLIAAKVTDVIVQPDH